MEYRASVSHDAIRQTVDIRLGTTEGHAAVEVDEFGNIIMEQQPEGVGIPPFLRLPHDAMLALRDALNGHAPPTSDADLREALAVERMRVNRAIDRLFSQREEGV